MPAPFPSIDVRQAEDYPLYGPPLQVRWIGNLYRLLVKEGVDRERVAKGEPPIHQAEIARLRQCDLHPTAGQYYLDTRVHEPAMEQRLQRNARRIVDEHLETVGNALPGVPAPPDTAPTQDPINPRPSVAVCSPPCSQPAGQGGSPLASQAPPPAPATTIDLPGPSVGHGGENDSGRQNQPAGTDELKTNTNEPRTTSPDWAQTPNLDFDEYDRACRKLCRSTDRLSKMAELLDTATRMHHIATEEFEAAVDHFRYAKAFRREANDFLRQAKRQFRRATRLHRAMVTRHRRAATTYRAAKKSRDVSMPAVPPFTLWHVNPPFPVSPERRGATGAADRLERDEAQGGSPMVHPTSNAGRRAMSEEKGQGGSPISSQTLDPKTPTTSIDESGSVPDRSPEACHGQCPCYDEQRARARSENDFREQNNPGGTDERPNTKHASPACSERSEPSHREPSRTEPSRKEHRRWETRLHNPDP